MPSSGSNSGPNSGTSSGGGATVFSALDLMDQFTNVMLFKLYDAYDTRIRHDPRRVRLKRRKAELVLPEVEKGGRRSRRRALSLGRDGGVRMGSGGGKENWKMKQQNHVHAQEQSKLMQLPAEIRNLVWEYVIGGTVRVEREGRRWVRFDVRKGGFVCVDEGEAEGRRRGRRGGDVEEVEVEVGAGRVVGWRVGDGDEDGEGGRGRRERSGVGVLGLLGSCRVVYSEVIGLLYSTPTFQIDEVQTFLAFLCTILPQRRQQIRYLKLGFLGRPGSRAAKELDDPVSYVSLMDLKALSTLPSRKVGDGKGDTYRHVVDEILREMLKLKT